MSERCNDVFFASGSTTGSLILTEKSSPKSSTAHQRCSEFHWSLWDQPPKASFDSNSDKEWLSWGKHAGINISADRRPLPASGRQEPDAAKQWEEYTRKERAHAFKRSVAFQAAEAANERQRLVKEKAKAAQCAAALFQWNTEVKQALDCLVLAKPVVALQILLSLWEDEAFTDTIDMKEHRKVAQMYSALYMHYELLKSFSVFINRSTSIDVQSIRFCCAECWVLILAPLQEVRTCTRVQASAL